MAKATIRVRGWLNAEGKWAAYGYKDCTEDEADSVLQDMLPDVDMGRPFWMTAEIEIPDAVEVVAKVSG